MSFLLRRVINPKVLLQPSTSVPLWLRVRHLSDEAVTWSDDKLKEAVQKDKIVVFMKGVPAQPMCGFSNAVVQILRMHGVEDFASYNVLDDEDLRQEIKRFSNWPTIPQVYIDGEFVGGCDIFIQMHREGDLIEELKKVGITSVLLEAENNGEGSKDNS